MTGKGHMLVTGVLVFTGWSLDEINWPFAIGSLIGSVLPDSDHKPAPIAHLIPTHWFIKKMPLTYTDRNGVTRTVMTKHRTITHSLLGWAVATALSYFVSVYFGLGIALGYGLHLWTDMGNITKLPYLYYPVIKNGAK